MKIAPIQRLRILFRRLYGLIGGKHWLPHVPLAIITAIGGIWLLQTDIGEHWETLVIGVLKGSADIKPNVLPPLLVGVGMLIMAGGLLFRSRIAWLTALLLAATAGVSMFFGNHENAHLLLAYFIAMLVLLLMAWRGFDHSSVAASSLFALSSVVMLLVYSTFGAYYLGQGFDPVIADLVTALYFSMVTMTTVGYGDISPVTTEAMLFTVSVIVLGVAVFATSLTAVIGPMVTNSFKHIVKNKGKGMKRENHFIVIGHSPLANNTCHELIRRGQHVTRILRDSSQLDSQEHEHTDVVIGDPGSIKILREAGGAKAAAILAMHEDDADNAFAILAARELGGHARTVAAVNDAAYMERIRLVQPNVVIAPQIFGGELAAMLLCGEKISSDYVMKQVFHELDDHPLDETPQSA